jgi:glyoxylase-like metal-dependent hydrolase (beta-lactamase superfamily II)
MIVERSMDSRWLERVRRRRRARRRRRLADSGAPLEPLVETIEREQLTPTHPAHARAPRSRRARGRPGAAVRDPVATGPGETGGLRIEAIETPGHSDDGVAFVLNQELCFSGDTLFYDAVGGGPADVVRESVMERLMSLDHGLRVLPGHTVDTTIGRAREQNPFVRFWRGSTQVGKPCRVGVSAASSSSSLRLRREGKYPVRLEGGEERIIGASRRSSPSPGVRATSARAGSLVRSCFVSPAARSPTPGRLTAYLPEAIRCSSSRQTLGRPSGQWHKPPTG